MIADPEISALFDATTELRDAIRRLTVLSERLLNAATSELPLSEEQAQQARRELDITRSGVERIDTLITMRRQQLRPL